MSLAQFIEQENRYRTFFNESPLDASKLTPEDAALLFRKIDSQMSPESLYRDGERRGAAARKVAKMLTSAFEELKARGFTPLVTLYNL